MKLAAVISTLAFAMNAQAHTRVWSVAINNVDQGDGRNQYIRSPPTNYPVKDTKSAAMRCGVNDKIVPKWVNAKAGDTVTFEWYHNTRQDEILDGSHKGPVLVYISPATGGSWTKIAHAGLDGGKWATEKLIANKGKHSAKIPASLKAGDYLLRAEVIGLQEADVTYAANNNRGVQFYPSCTQLRVTKGGNASPPGGLQFPGSYKAEDPSLKFNIYGNPTRYTIPGGNAVWSG